MSSRIAPDWDIRDAILDAGGAEAYKCYQCGKCMAVCPWSHIDAVDFPVYRTPQAVRYGAIMNSEDVDEIEREVEEIFRCVGCEACTSSCPHEISLPRIMRSIRRILVEFGSCPSELADAAARIHSSGNPFGEPREKRADYAGEIGVPRFEPEMDFLYMPCCVPAYDPRARQVAVATLKVLKVAEVSFGTLDDAVQCCGEAIRRAGAEDVFQTVAGANVAALEAAGVRRVVASSPHCSSSLKTEYRELGATFEIVHQTQLLFELVSNGRLEPRVELGRRVAYHDPCTLGRLSGVYDEPREVLRSIPGLELIEIPTYSREFSVCCGGGSGGMWLERPKGERLSDCRVQQAVEAGAEILAVACPYCLQMFEDSVKTLDLDLEVFDVAELVAAAL